MIVRGRGQGMARVGVGGGMGSVWRRVKKVAEDEGWSEEVQEGKHTLY